MKPPEECASIEDVRRQAMLEARRRWAEEEGLSPNVLEAVYETLISYFVDREMDRWRNTLS